MRRWAFVLMLCAAVMATAAQQTSASSAPLVVPAEEKPLPDIAALMLAVEKHEDRDEALLAKYTFHLHAATETFDRDDEVKKAHTADYEVIPVNGVHVTKLVARDGRPLTGDEAQKEEKDFDRKAAEQRKRKDKADAKKAEAEESGKSNDGFLTASRALQLGTFRNERRVMLDGRPTIVLDYAGNRDVRTRTALEKAVEDLVGTVWIDEDDQVIAKTEGKFLKDFKVGFGLIMDIHKDFSFASESRKINGEIWMPAQFHGSGKASVLVFLGVHGRGTWTMSDYRKYRTKAEIVGTSGPIDDNGQPVPQPDLPSQKPEP